MLGTRHLPLGTKPIAATMRLLLMLQALFAWCASAALAVAADNSTIDIDWLKAANFSYLVPDVEECARVSGFQFSENTRPTALQLSRMCGQSSCAVVADNFRMPLTAIQVERIKALTFLGFVVPFLDFCWYYRLPGDACPADPMGEFQARFADQILTCEGQTNMILSDFNRTDVLAEVTVRGVKASRDNPCPTICTDLVSRQSFLHGGMPCSDTKYNKQKSAMIVRYTMDCLIDFGYKYRSDWPVPSVQDPSEAIAIPGANTGDHVSSVDSSRVSDDVVDETIVPVSATSPEPTSTNQTTPIAGVQTDSSSHTLDTVAPATTTPQGNESTTKSKPSAGSITEEKEFVDAPDAVKNGKDDQRGHGLVVVSAWLTVSVLVLVVVIVLLRRKRTRAKRTPESEYLSMATTPSCLPTAGGSDRPILAQNLITRALPVDCIKDVRLIGMGGYGAVYLVRDTRTDRLLASKRLVNHQLTKPQIDAFMDEIRLVSTLHHPCIVSFVGATWTNQTDIQALFEYMDGGDLRSYLEATSPGQQQWAHDKLTIAIDVADALDYVHTQLAIPVVHRDLKSPNILLQQSPRRAKLSDFGVSRELSTNFSMTTGVGTGRWLAPEVILGGGVYDASCDIYSLGVVLTELDTHHVPFADEQLPEITILSMVALEGRQPRVSESCPLKIAELARWCMSFKPEERPSAAVVAKTLREILEAFGTDA